MLKKYNVFYADPPWEQKAGRKLDGYKIVNGIQIWNSSNPKPKNLPYPTMTVEEIANLPIKNISEKDSILFLWVTNKYLLESKKVIESWGFTYVACITWKKKRMGGGLGGVVRITSEYLLFCRKGNLKCVGNIPENVIEAKRPYVNGKPVNSKKPENFRQIIEELVPDGKRLELFARNNHEKWDAFGNEIENSIKI
jgi:N6-adenosine-specific RNA methylase IME4